MLSANEVSMIKDYTVIKVKGRLDAGTTEKFLQTAAAQAEQNPKIILDFSGLEYISSAGLRAVLLTAKKSSSQGGSFAVAAACSAVADIFRVAGFDGIIRMTETVSEITG